MLEIKYALSSVPLMGFLTCILFMAEVHGYSKLYDNVHDSKFGKLKIFSKKKKNAKFAKKFCEMIHNNNNNSRIYIAQN